MKAFLLFAISLTAGLQATAQQPKTVKPLATPQVTIPQFSLKTDTGSLRQFNQGNNFLMPNLVAPINANLLAALNSYSARVKRSSIDHMPIVKTDEPGMKYTMLIKPVDINVEKPHAAITVDKLPEVKP